MRHTLRTIITLAVFLCLVPCGAKDGTDGEAADTGLLPAGAEAPDLKIITDESPEGYTLDSLRGRTVVLEFWASWCPDCRKVADRMKDMHALYASDKVVFLGFSFDTDEGKWKNYVKENGLSWIQTRDAAAWKESAAARAWKVKWIPSFYIISPEGKVAFASTTAGSLEEALGKLAEGSDSYPRFFR